MKILVYFYTILTQKHEKKSKTIFCPLEKRVFEFHLRHLLRCNMHNLLVSKSHELFSFGTHRFSNEPCQINEISLFLYVSLTDACVQQIDEISQARRDPVGIFRWHFKPKDFLTRKMWEKAKRE